MYSIYETYCDLRDLTIGKGNVFIRRFSESGETRPANGLSLNGSVVAKIVCCGVLYDAFSLHFYTFLEMRLIPFNVTLFKTCQPFVVWT